MAALLDSKAVESFLIHEARLLDDRKFEDWMALFDDEGFYWAPSVVGQQSPLTEVSIFFDNRELMAQRITRLRHERVHSQIPHSRTMHMVSNVVASDIPGDAGEISVTSKFLVLEYRPSVPEGVQRMFGGEYQHILKETDGSFRILGKKAMLINCDSAFGPLAVYF
ncbi:aromatic-ring-hydroxylating dioxygenase subunit beta [Bordetella sp. H567]|uniref:aromatic-ring-hydroxylating dioxygenase subunit beta n=1 Tax=Bordetella sp. H567 TaxID=1697043 RepID=UPI0008305172|nr:aromatic-ring-hydroxylating dioxygenase subunit beta [Bordetella sp. H567]